MGSWNETCALTGLPILDGQKVYVIQVVDEYDDDKTPSSPTFSGTYDDYGRVVFDSDTPRPLFYNPSGGKVVPVSDETWSVILDVEEPQAVFFLQQETDSIIEYYLQERRKSDEQSLSYGFYPDQKLSSYENFKKFIERAFDVELIEDQNPKVYETPEKTTSIARLQRQTQVEIQILWKVESALFLRTGLIRFLYGVYTDHPDQWDETLRATYNMLILRKIFGSLNKSWFPAAKGRQHYPSGLHRFIAQAVIKAVDADEAALAEEYVD